MMTTLELLDPSAAESVIEQLRYGIPPAESVRAFTVGREEQMRALEQSLRNPTSDGGAALLVKANYGAGKSHLLRVIREVALDAGYAVSLVVVNAQEGTRFNRMDTVFGAVCREIEVDHSGRKGVGQLFDLFVRTSTATLQEGARGAHERITGRGRWDHSDYLKAPGVYIALRAWAASNDACVHDLIKDWLANPGNYRSQRRLLYTKLVGELRGRFTDRRPEWQFYADELFLFSRDGHRQAWDGLADLDAIAKAAGLRGLVLLFDEFEDVVQNLNRRDLQQQAFLNLLHFFAGDRYPGMSYLAVTPDFAHKCKQELLSRGVYDFDYSQLEHLPFFEMDPITEQEFLLLASRIRSVHGIAYDWDSSRHLPDVEMKGVVRRLWTVSSPERVRRAVQGLVACLDERCERFG